MASRMLGRCQLRGLHAGHSDYRQASTVLAHARYAVDSKTYTTDVAHPQLNGLEDMPFFSQFPLDRQAELRKSPEALADALAQSDAVLLPLARDKVLVRAAGAGSEHSLVPVMLSPAASHMAAHISGTTTFMGVDSVGSPYFAAQVQDPASLTQPGAEAENLPHWMSARLAGQQLSPAHAALLAVASGLSLWHQASAFHPVSGSPTVLSQGGFARRCTTTNATIYPRVDPAVIMLVTARGSPANRSGSPTSQQQHLFDDYCLLGRKAEWPPGRYSTLAGFLEVGEPLEVAVARETAEESGVVVDLSSVQYYASQPWPFPRSLMVGFFARASQLHLDESSSSQMQREAGFDLLPPEGRRAAMDVGLHQEEVQEAMLHTPPPIVVDRTELEDCKWFHRDWLRACLLPPGPGQLVPANKGDFQIPGQWSLAHRLINTWLDPAARGEEGAWPGDLIPQVAIDEGVFKYVLLRLTDDREGGTGKSKLLVWGNAAAGYHMDCFREAKMMAAKHGLEVMPLGGGRMEHHSAEGTVKLYGYSSAFGAAPHEVAAALVRRWHPLYSPYAVTTSYQGY